MKEPGDWFTLAGAIATLFTGVVAIGLGLAGMDKTDRDALARGQIILEQAAVQVEAMVIRLMGIETSASRQLGRGADRELLGQWMNVLRENHLEFPIDLLIGIHPVSAELAKDLARAWALVGILHKDAIANPTAGSEVQAHDHVAACLKMLKEAIFLMDRSMRLLSVIRKSAHQRSSSARCNVQ